MTKINNESVFLNNEMLSAFNLKIGDKLMVVKSTTIAMSFTPVEIWKEKFKKRGLLDTIKNMDLLPEF